ncbi:MAG: hypothetical protein NTW16_06775 [Bacteroidetes bacterium]|nr:hypothetical protein [Bacteroidota bacterium]
MNPETQQTVKSTIEQLREIREKISIETQDMTFEQFKKYAEDRMTETIHPNATWQIKGGM